MKHTECQKMTLCVFGISQRWTVCSGTFGSFGFWISINIGGYWELNHPQPGCSAEKYTNILSSFTQFHVPKQEFKWTEHLQFAILFARYTLLKKCKNGWLFVSVLARLKTQKYPKQQYISSSVLILLLIIAGPCWSHDSSSPALKKASSKSWRTAPNTHASGVNQASKYDDQSASFEGKEPWFGCDKNRKLVSKGGCSKRRFYKNWTTLSH